MSMNKPKLEQIINILLKHDPIGIDYGLDQDEYKLEAETILDKLHGNLSKEEIQEIVFEQFVRWFSIETAGKKDRYRKIAEDIYELSKSS